VQIGTRAVFTLILLLVGLSETVGAENILGAFLAGVLVSLLAPNQEMIHKLDSFGYGFLIPIFFVMVGVDLNVWS
ncbi:cation:proton antiporter domain-containing protein, partial [Micrococcus luteus]